MHLFADATDPATWLPFVEKTGVPAFLALVGMVGVGWIGYKLGGKIIEYLFGPNGWIAKFKERLDKFLDTLEKNSLDNSALLANQNAFCKNTHSFGGAANVVDIRAAGHAFAEMGRDIGEKVGVDVGKHADKIHDVLRNEPMA